MSGASTMKLLLDTDMHDTCDDIGAMAVMHVLSGTYNAEILGITYSAYDEPGLKCIEIVNNYFGRPQIPIGAYKKLRLDYSGNMRSVAKLFPSSIDRNSAEPAVRLMRKVLAKTEKVTVVGIGPLFNLRDLLESESDDISEKTGKELVAGSTQELILMAGNLKGKSEYNIYLDSTAASSVFSKWPNTITICDFSIGAQVSNGKTLHGDYSNPISAAYSYCGKSESYDLLAMHYALTRDSRIWSLSEPGEISVNGENVSWVGNIDGKHHYLILKIQYGEIEKILEDILMQVREIQRA
jgi:purine nucleosidase